MDSDLVGLITELVLAELGKSAPADAPAPSAPAPVSEPKPVARPKRLAMICPAPGSTVSQEPLWLALREISDLGWLLVRTPGVCLDQARQALGGGKIQEIDPPSSWDDPVSRVEAGILPVLTIDLMARLGLLLSDQPAAGAAITAIVQGKPVLACASELNQVRRSSGRLPGGFLSVFHQHVRSLEGLGVQVLEPPALANQLGRTKAASAPTASARGRDVVTVEDLEAVARAGQKKMMLSPGTIVTPLARDKAAQMGIEMSFS